jgi:hypothetical protein
MEISPRTAPFRRGLLRIISDLDQFSNQIFAVFTATRPKTFNLRQRDKDIMAGKAEYAG